MPDGSINAIIRDRIVDRSIDLQHFTNTEARKMVGLLNRVDGSLAERLAKAINKLGADSFKASHLNKVLESVRELNRDVYDQLYKSLRDDLKELSRRELTFQEAMFASAIPASVQVKIQLSKVSARRVWAAATARPFQGRLLKEWIKSLEADRAARVRDSIRIGIVEGRTTDEIVRTIVGRKSQRYRDGIINRDRGHVMAVVRTAIAHVSTNARDAYYRENSDLIKGIIWDSTLDTGTTPICQIRDQKKYTLEGKPIGHKIPYLSGPGKSHWGCRSNPLPWVKSWRELGFDVDELDAGTRSSMDGYVPEDMSFGDWFKKQSTERQDEVLGPTRGKLYREGKYTLSKFYNNKGRIIPLKEL